MNRFKFLLVLITIILTSSLTSKSQKKLFDGKSLAGWHVDVPAKDKDANIPESFIVRNGLLVSKGEPRGHLITDEIYQNYRLTAVYRFTGKPGNCGILVHSSAPRVLYEMFPKSMEVQMQHKDAGDFWCIGEDIMVPNMEERRGKKESWGTIAGKSRRIKNLTDDSENPLGEWNTMVIECYKNNIKVWVNGILVNEGTNCTVEKGQIAVQAEGAEVEFQKLTLKPIKKLSQSI